jgi:exopolyphosphatase
MDLSLAYLKRAYSYASLTIPFHEDYHNLRKTLRSFIDEWHLFGETMLPGNTSTTNSVIQTLTTARGLLGDMNDDWTAYRFYLERNEYHKLQKKLGHRISAAWADFKVWANASDFEGSIGYLKTHMESTLPNRKPLSLDAFLKARKERPTRHFVVGNTAGDADSIISAITLGYIESVKGVTEKTPIVSIPRADLETQRPETVSLLKLAGISHAAGVLLFVDQPVVTESTEATEVTLVDHNRLADIFQQKDWKVVEIVDHHRDERMYMDTCSGSSRWITFDDNKALVASACTLVVERMKELWRPPDPSSLGVLLLGVILLDSVNLSPEAGKVTQRDRDAVQSLLVDTNWQGLPQESKEVLKVSPSSGPNTTAFFHALQETKFDPGFWNSLSVRHALWLDYKDYSYKDGVFGVSTVLMPLDSFLVKQDLITGIQ